MDDSVGETQGEDWQYIAEGAGHVVFGFYPRTSPVHELAGLAIRFRKDAVKACLHNEPVNPPEVRAEYMFEKEVVRPLLGARFVPASRVVSVPCSLLWSLLLAAAPLRPTHRKKKDGWSESDLRSALAQSNEQSCPQPARRSAQQSQPAPPLRADESAPQTTKQQPSAEQAAPATSTSSERPQKRQRLTQARSVAALLVPNLLALPPGRDAQQGVLCVEIKPKWGFLPVPTYVKPIKTQVCRYCLHQQLKHVQGDIARVSDYCPLDLFAASPARIAKAVWSLLHDPQNNLRLFTSHAADVRPRLWQPPGPPTSPRTPASCQQMQQTQQEGGQSKQEGQEGAGPDLSGLPVLTELLDRLFASQTQSPTSAATESATAAAATSTSAQCAQQTRAQRLVQLLVLVLTSSPARVLLTRIRTAQRELDRHDIEGVIGAYRELLQRCPEQASAAAVDHADRGQWHPIVRRFQLLWNSQHLSETLSTAAGPAPCQRQQVCASGGGTVAPVPPAAHAPPTWREQDTAELLAVVRQFVLGATLKDLSIMLTIGACEPGSQPQSGDCDRLNPAAPAGSTGQIGNSAELAAQRSGEGAATNLHNLETYVLSVPDAAADCEGAVPAVSATVGHCAARADGRRQLWFRIAITDVEPKCASRIPYYHQQDQLIARNFLELYPHCQANQTL
eukprot:g60385.t1